MLWRMLIAVAVLQGTLLMAAPQPYLAKTFDEACKELRDRGFPATLDDLVPVNYPDDKNGAVYVRRAGEAVVASTSGPRASGLEYGPSLPYPKQWFAEAEASEKANAAALDLVRKARACGNQISWDFHPNAAPSERMQRLLGSLSPIRALANVVADEALLQHFQGKDAAAFETLRDLRYLVEANAHRPFLVSALVNIGLRSLVADDYHLVALDLHVASRPGDGGVDRKAVKEAIASLMDDAPVRAQASRCMLEERVYGLADAKASGIAGMPAWQADLPAILSLYDELAAQMDQPVWQPVKLSSQPNGPYATLYKSLTTSADKWHQYTYRTILTQRVSGVALAVALYHRDKGFYPKSLQDLVPEYLVTMPVDPYSRVGNPLLYRVLDGKRPRLGTVGPDGVDAGMADEAPTQGQYQIDLGRPGKVPDDAWVDLALWK